MTRRERRSRAIEAARAVAVRGEAEALGSELTECLLPPGVSFRFVVDHLETLPAIDPAIRRAFLGPG